MQVRVRVIEGRGGRVSETKCQCGEPLQGWKTFECCQEGNICDEEYTIESDEDVDFYAAVEDKWYGPGEIPEPEHDVFDAALSVLKEGKCRELSAVPLPPATEKRVEWKPMKGAVAWDFRPWWGIVDDGKGGK